jgi:hypothetical protein
MNNDTRTLAQLAEEALFVQGACNLSGVVHAFSRSISRLRELCPAQGTDFYNTHPLCVLFTDKIAHLVGIQAFSDDEEVCTKFSKAYQWAKQTAAQKTP